MKTNCEIINLDFMVNENSYIRIFLRNRNFTSLA